METVPFEAINGHIVLLLSDGMRALLDTGSPTSFGRGQVDLLGHRFPLGEKPALMDLVVLARHVGTRIDALVGMDVLGKLRFLVRWSSQTVEFSREPFTVTGESVPLEELLGCPIVTFEVAGQRARGFLDTGAVRSYVADGSLLPPAVGTATDFRPGLGGFHEFTTDLYRLETRIGGKSLVQTFGRLPAEFQLLLGLSGVGWIHGTSEMCARWDLLVDAPAKRMTLVERG